MRCNPRGCRRIRTLKVFGQFLMVCLAGCLAGCLAAALITIPALAAMPPLPSSFYGTVKVDGQNVPDGTPVRALVGGQVAAQGVTQTYQGDSYYALNVAGDDPSTPIREGGRENDAIQFQIGEDLAGQTGTWKGGTNVRLDLTLGNPGQNQVTLPTVTPSPEKPDPTGSPAGANPTRTASPAPSKTPTNSPTAVPSTAPATPTAPAPSATSQPAGAGTGTDTPQAQPAATSQPVGPTPAQTALSPATNPPPAPTAAPTIPVQVPAAADLLPAASPPVTLTSPPAVESEPPTATPFAITEADSPQPADPGPGRAGGSRFGLAIVFGSITVAGLAWFAVRGRLPKKS